MALREINDLRPKIGRNEYRNGEKALKLGFWQLLFEGKVVYLVHNYNGRLHSWVKVFFFSNILSCLRGKCRAILDIFSDSLYLEFFFF